jgi:tetratricopeptide (TPR) repeat protein
MQQLYPERLNENLERLAHHASRAEQWEEAIRFGWGSGQRLIEHNAMRPALESFQIVLDAFERLNEPDAHLATAIDTHSQMRDCYFVLGEHDHVRPHLDAATALSERTGDLSKVAWGRLQMSAFYWAAGMLEDAVAEGETALEVGGHLVEENFDALTHYRLGTVLTALGRFPEAIDHLDRALERLDTEQNRRFFQFGGWPYCFVCSFLSWSLAETGNFDRAAALAEAGYSLAAGERQAYTQCVATFGLSHVMLLKGQSEFAVPVLERSLELARTGDAGATQPWIASRLVYGYALEGMADRALETLRENLDETGLSKGPAHASSYDWVVRALYLLGRYDDTYHYLDLLEERARRQSESAVLGWGQLVRIKTDLATHRIDTTQAAKRFIECRQLAESLSMRALVSACDEARLEVERSDR